MFASRASSRQAASSPSRCEELRERRGRESNPRIAVLQTATLPLGYPANGRQRRCGAPDCQSVDAPPRCARASSGDLFPGRCRGVCPCRARFSISHAETCETSRRAKRAGLPQAQQVRQSVHAVRLRQPRSHLRLRARAEVKAACSRRSAANSQRPFSTARGGAARFHAKRSRHYKSPAAWADPSTQPCAQNVALRWANIPAREIAPGPAAMQRAKAKMLRQPWRRAVAGLSSRCTGGSRPK